MLEPFVPRSQRLLPQFSQDLILDIFKLPGIDMAEYIDEWLGIICTEMIFHIHIFCNQMTQGMVNSENK